MDPSDVKKGALPISLGGAPFVVIYIAEIVQVMQRLSLGERSYEEDGQHRMDTWLSTPGGWK